MVPPSFRTVQRLLGGRWLVGLWLVLAPAFGWACPSQAAAVATPAAVAAQAVQAEPMTGPMNGPMTGPMTGPITRPITGPMARPANSITAATRTAVPAAEHPCGHASARAAAMATGASGGAVAPTTPSPSPADAASGDTEPCSAHGAQCNGLCATVCLPVPAAGAALPLTAADLRPGALAEACPVRPAWAATGRCIAPESPPPIV